VTDDTKSGGGANARFSAVPSWRHVGLKIPQSSLPRFWRPGHAHAGVYLVLSPVMLRHVDDAALSPSWKWLARTGAPIAAILIPAAFFLSVASPTAREPNDLINLAYVGALFLAGAVLTLGVGLIRAARQNSR
jgi:hypothetical protein